MSILFKNECFLNPTEFVEKKGPELFGDYVFFFGVALFFDFLLCPVSLLFAASWSWKLPFTSIGNILEFEPPIFHGFHGICNMLMLELFMLHGILL